MATFLAGGTLVGMQINQTQGNWEEDYVLYDTIPSSSDEEEWNTMQLTSGIGEKPNETLPIINGWFTENRGQIENHEVKFVCVTPTNTMGFVESGYVIGSAHQGRMSYLKVSYVDSNDIAPKGREILPHRSNFFQGSDPDCWTTMVPNYRELVYEDLYDGIDLIFTMTGKGVKYDLVIAPYSDPQAICLSYDGADDIYIDQGGDMHIETPSSELLEGAPFSYQMIGGEVQEIESGYFVESDHVSFTIGDYDESRELIIDPLIFSTFIGGSDKDTGNSLALDPEGNSYLTGTTTSNDFPTSQECYNDSKSGWLDVFVLKMNPDGSEVVYSTYVGGAGNINRGYRIALDNQSNAYVTGVTASDDFPTTPGCFDDSYNGGDYNSFVFKLNHNGTELIYSTYLGEGSGSGIAVDSDFNAYITGGTTSEDFPTTPGCYDDTHGGDADVYVCKLNPDGSDLIFSTFVGGEFSEYARSITLDSMNNTYMTGLTRSWNFPTTSDCYDDSYNGDMDCFVFRMNPDGNDLVFSTYIGGRDDDLGKSIQVDNHNNSYISGYTNSENFPTTPGCYDDSHNGKNDVFVVKLDSSGKSLGYSTFIGGVEDDGNWDYGEGCDLYLDSNGMAVIAGVTLSDDFPTTPGCYDDTFNGEADVFVCRLILNGSALQYSTFVGGRFNDHGNRISLDSQDNVFVTGWTWSPDFPTTPGCYDDTINEDRDVFLFELDISGKLTARIDAISPNPALEAETIEFRGHGSGSGEIIRYVWSSSLNGELHNDSVPDFSTNLLDMGSHIIRFGVQEEGGNWSEDRIDYLNVTRKPQAFIQDGYPSPDPALPSHIIEFRGWGTDDHGIDLFQWSSDIDGILSNGSDSNFSIADLSPGQHTISFRCRDDMGFWSDDVQGYINITNRPIAVIDDIDPKPALLGENITFTGHGIADGSIEQFVWTSSRDGELYNGSEETFITDGLSQGYHSIYLSVRDDLGFWSDDAQGYISITTRPIAVIDDIDPNPALVGENITFTGHGIDDGSIEHYVWTSSLNGEVYSGNDETFVTDNLSQGHHTIYLSVCDDLGFWSDNVQGYISVTNRPIAVIDDIVPNPALFGEMITFTGRGIDDGSIERYVWTSSRDGELYQGSEDHFSTENLSLGHHTISLAVQNDLGFWSEMASSTLEIMNKPDLLIPLVHADPQNPQEGTIVVMNASIKNSGGWDAMDVTVTLEGKMDIPGGDWFLVGTTTIPLLKAGATDSIEQEWNTTSFLGDVQLRITVDPDDTIAELNEDDNQRFLIVEVIIPINRYGVRISTNHTSLAISVEENSVETISVEVENTGKIKDSYLIFFPADLRGWLIELISPQIITLEPGEIDTIFIKVMKNSSIPTEGEMTNIVITVRSATHEEVQDSVSVSISLETHDEGFISFLPPAFTAAAVCAAGVVAFFRGREDF